MPVNYCSCKFCHGDTFTAIALGKMMFVDSYTEQSGSLCSAIVVLVPQVFNAQGFNLNMTPYSNINHRVSWCNQLLTFQQAHPDQNLS
jgi:hypothetical protein